MSFFKKFPSIVYKGQKAESLITAVNPSHMGVDKSFVFQRYTIKELESAEAVADLLYKDANLYWTIFVINNIVNPFLDWPVSDSELEEIVVLKYGDVNSISHYFDNRLNRICDDVDEAAYRLVPASTLPFYIVPVTHYAAEKEANDSKRDITVINPKYISQFVETYYKALEGKT